MEGFLEDDWFPVSSTLKDDRAVPTSSNIPLPPLKEASLFPSDVEMQEGSSVASPLASADTIPIDETRTFLPNSEVQASQKLSSPNASKYESSSGSRVVRFRKSHPKAFFPSRGTKKSVGWDFYSCEKKTINPLGRAVINTGIQVRFIPNGYFLKLESRSGLSVNHGIITVAGIIDPDYTDSVKVVLFNTESTPFKINIGDKISQGVFYKTLDEQKIQPVAIVSRKRKTKGFGSTGNK